MTLLFHVRGLKFGLQSSVQTTSNRWADHLPTLIDTMVTGMNCVPFELLELICQHLQKEDIKSTRQVSKILYEAASPLLIQRAWISTTPEDQRTLKAIASHKIFAQNVREIAYDGTIYDQELVTSPIEWSLHRSIPWSKNGLTHAFREYGERYHGWSCLQGYRRKHQRRNRKSSPPNFESLIGDAKQIHKEADCVEMAQLEECLPADLVFLLQALPRLPKARSFTLTDR